MGVSGLVRPYLDVSFVWLLFSIEKGEGSTPPWDVVVGGVLRHRNGIGGAFLMWIRNGKPAGHGVASSNFTRLVSRSGCGGLSLQTWLRTNRAYNLVFFYKAIKVFVLGHFLPWLHGRLTLTAIQ